MSTPTSDTKAFGPLEGSAADAIGAPVTAGRVGSTVTALVLAAPFASG